MATNIRPSISIFNRLRRRESRCQPPICPASPVPTLVSDNHISQQFVKFERGPIPRIPMRRRRRQHPLPPGFPARGRRRPARPTVRLLAALPLDRLVNTMCVREHVSVCQRCACACVCVCVRTHLATWIFAANRSTVSRRRRCCFTAELGLLPNDPLPAPELWLTGDTPPTHTLGPSAPPARDGERCEVRPTPSPPPGCGSVLSLRVPSGQVSRLAFR